MKSVKLIVLGALALALGACGGSIQNKEDAVKVAQRLEAMGAKSNTLAQGLTSKLITSSVTLPGESGTATCTVSTDATFDGVSAQFTVDVSATMDAYSPDGDNTYDGTETVHWAFTGLATDTTASGSIVMTLKSDMKVEGDYNNQVQADVTMTLDASVIAATSGKVSMVIDGTITVDGTVYSYDHETFEVSVN